MQDCKTKCFNGESNKTSLVLQSDFAKQKEAIANLMNAIEHGIITNTTKQRMIELENTKEDLELKSIKDEMKRPPLTKEGLIF